MFQEWRLRWVKPAKLLAGIQANNQYVTASALGGTQRLRSFDNGRTSYGIGARLILSGVIIRFDLAHGDEGAQTQLFITYPWSMFSVDKPNRFIRNDQANLAAVY